MMTIFILLCLYSDLRLCNLGWTPMVDETTKQRSEGKSFCHFVSQKNSSSRLLPFFLLSLEHFHKCLLGIGLRPHIHKFLDKLTKWTKDHTRSIFHVYKIRFLFQNFALRGIANWLRYNVQYFSLNINFVV